MNLAVRVRYAPSPTGYLHIGGLRVALFNWLFAKQNNGQFLIRIEDTDLERSKAEYIDAILDAFRWVNINPDEPIIIQSSRLESHKLAIQYLLDNNYAYKCYCTENELRTRLGESSVSSGFYTKYDRLCRYKNVNQDENKSFVVRFKIAEENEVISWNDFIRGTISFNCNVFDDFVIQRSDGMPTYNLVVVVDDNFSKISHVLRGEDHISNTPKQIMLYKALNYNIPYFGHFPLILGPDGNRLSKRDAATSVLDYKNEGYLPEALLNYLVRLGWSYKDREIFSLDELIKLFNLDNVGKKSAIFDINKLRWLNNVYIKNSNNIDILFIILKDIDKNFYINFSNWSLKSLIDAIELFKDRSSTLKELLNSIKSLYNKPELSLDIISINDYINLETYAYMNQLKLVLEELEFFDLENLKKSVKILVYNLNIDFSNIAKPLRLALTGSINSPSIYNILSILGKRESIDRINIFMNFIYKNI